MKNGNRERERRKYKTAGHFCSVALTLLVILSISSIVVTTVQKPFDATKTFLIRHHITIANQSVRIGSIFRVFIFYFCTWMKPNKKVSNRKK